MMTTKKPRAKMREMARRCFKGRWRREIPGMGRRTTRRSVAMFREALTNPVVCVSRGGRVAVGDGSD
jgi:hypothetical protein